MNIARTHGGQPLSINVERTAEGLRLWIGKQSIVAQAVSIELPRITFLLNGKLFTAYVATDGKRDWVHHGNRTYLFERADGTRDGQRAARSAEGSASGLVTAPMPGQVRATMVSVGDKVEEGQPLLLLEAMKMEMRVSAPRAGVVLALTVEAGQSVEREQVLGEVG